MASSEPISKRKLGMTKDGKEVFVFTLTSENITINVLNFGCVVKDILVADRDGNVVDVCLGYDSFDGYEENPAFMGAICGRVANRIDGATFDIDGVKYEVSKNDYLGNSMCHGGFKGLTRKCFDWSMDGSKLCLTYTDADGSEGFPGDLTVKVTYELTAESGLMIDYQATTNKPTPVDLSHHLMINLAGHGKDSIGDHVVSVNSSKKLDLNPRFIPTGTVSNTTKTLFDFQKPTKLRDVLDKMPVKDGLHVPHILPGPTGEKKLVAKAVHPTSGRYLEVFTTEPVLMSYLSFCTDFVHKSCKYKGGLTYKKCGWLLFMPQWYPDAVTTVSTRSV